MDNSSDSRSHRVSICAWSTNICGTQEIWKIIKSISFIQQNQRYYKTNNKMLYIAILIPVQNKTSVNHQLAKYWLHIARLVVDFIARKGQEKLLKPFHSCSSTSIFCDDARPLTPFCWTTVCPGIWPLCKSWFKRSTSSNDVAFAIASWIQNFSILLNFFSNIKNQF